MTDERCQSNLNAFGNARVSFGHANRDVPLGCLHCVSVHSESPCVTVRVVCVQVAHNGTLLLRFMSVTKLHPFTVTPRSFRVRLREVRKFRMQDARCADQTDGRCLARCDGAECGVVGIIGGSQEIGERALQVRPTPLLLVLRLCARSKTRTRRMPTCCAPLPSQERVTCKPRRPRNWWQTYCSRARPHSCPQRS